MKRNHTEEKEIIEIFQYKKNSKERKRALSLLRNEINFDLYLKGMTMPNRQRFEIDNEGIEYYPCAFCKGLFAKVYLNRHVKNCIADCANPKGENGIKTNYLSQSHTLMACATDPTQVISQLNVKEKVNIFTHSSHYKYVKIVFKIS